MSYENWKIKKTELEEKQEEYSAVADWCNETQTHHIEEIGDEYCVVKNPEPLPPTKEEVSETRKQLYIEQVDPITAQISRLRDEEQTEEVVAKIEALKAERSELVAKIKEENPYPEEPTETATSEAVDDSE